MSLGYCQGILGELFLRTKVQNQGCWAFSCYLYLGLILLNMLSQIVRYPEDFLLLGKAL